MRWIDYAYTKWPQQNMVAEIGRGAYTKHLKKTGILELHHCAYPDKKTMRGNVLNSLDCGPTLNPSMDKIREMTRIAIDKNAHLLIYRGELGNSSMEEDKINVIGEEIQR